MPLSNPQTLILFPLFLLLTIRQTTADAPSKKPKIPSPSPPAAGRGGATFVFPIYGDVYPSGLYYVAMNIGDPPKPYFLDLDTGSDLTWLQCDAPCVRCDKAPHPYYKPRAGSLVPCNDPLCIAIQSEQEEKFDVEENCEQCDYLVHYHDGSSLGVLVTETIPLRFGNMTLRPQFTIGCGYDQSQPKDNAPSQTDGVLGLGSGAISILSQLGAKGISRNVGHCLSSKGGGYLFFGDNYVSADRITWVPMSSTKSYYSPGPTIIYWGSHSLGVKQQEVVFDSGSTYTYFNRQSYQAFLTAVKKDLAGTPLKEAPEEKALPVCWKGPKPFKSVDEVNKYFRILTLNFINGKKSLFQVPPTNYLVITESGNVCLGILDGEENGLNNLNVIGDILMLDMLVVYDNEKRQIGWIRAACNRLANEDDNNEGTEEGSGLPQIPHMGILTEEHPDSYNLQ